jgi:hypothetical protein
LHRSLRETGDVTDDAQIVGAGLVDVEASATEGVGTRRSRARLAERSAGLIIVPA